MGPLLRLAQATVALTLGAVAAAAPVDVGLRETTEAQLVLLDVLVLDRKERTVAGLAVSDFELLVEGDFVAIASFDARCPLGAADDARAARASESRSSLAGSGRLVLAFDWSHMNVFGSRLHAYDALRSAIESVRRGGIAADKIMVVSLGDSLRVELPFTSDREQVLAVLQAVESDPWIASDHQSINDFAFFRRLFALLDLMEQIPDRKAIVLFSGPMENDGWTHDNEYARLASMAATSRTSIYPVDAGGLRTMLDRYPQPLGGPARLHRIADETGGRMTADTNDLSLGIGRAARDLGCTYTLGFRDPAPRPDRARRLTVLLPGRRGVRAVYPASYVVRSPAERARSLLETASLHPASFTDDGLRIDAYVGDPVTSKRQGVTILVSIEAPEESFALGDRELRGFVRSPSGAIVHHFERCIAPGATSVVENVALRPGRYVVIGVLEDPGGGSPAAAIVELSVPEAP